NSFFGDFAGLWNTFGTENSFFGLAAGNGSSQADSNTVECCNTFFGAYANGAPGVNKATAVGYKAKVTLSNSLVLGSINGVNGADVDTNVGIGTSAPSQRLHVVGNSFFNGNVGIGTSGPASVLHLNGNSGNFALTFTNQANTSGRRGYRIAFDNDR